MVLLDIGIILLIAAVFMALLFKALWLASVLVIFFAVKATLSFEMVTLHLGIDSKTIYYAIIVAVAYMLHYFVFVRLLSEMGALKIPIYVALIVWFLFRYDFTEFLVIKDWLAANNLWGRENFHDGVKDAFSTPVDVMLGYMIDALKTFTDGLWDIIEKITKGKIQRNS